MITPLTWSFHLFLFVSTSSRYSQVIKITLLEGASVKKQHCPERRGKYMTYSMRGQGKIQLADNLSWQELYMLWQEALCSSREVASCWGSNGKSDLTEESAQKCSEQKRWNTMCEALSCLVPGLWNWKDVSDKSKTKQTTTKHQIPWLHKCLLYWSPWILQCLSPPCSVQQAYGVGSLLKRPRQGNKRN